MPERGSVGARRVRAAVRGEWCDPCPRCAVPGSDHGCACARPVAAGRCGGNRNPVERTESRSLKVGMTLGAAADVHLARSFTRLAALDMRQPVILPGVLLTAARALLDNGVPSQQPCRAFFVPGRIELLGKHTDYGGGPSAV